MFRLVSLVFLGVIVVQPVFAQNNSSAQMSAGSKPGSSIALSPYAIAKRDEARDANPIGRPALQVSLPAQTTPVPRPFAVPLPQATTTPVRQPVTPTTQVTAIPARPLAVPLPQPTAVVPVQPPATPLPVTPPIPAPQGTIKTVPTTAKNPNSEVTKPVALPQTPMAQPKSLASREAMRQRMLLSQLDADLAGTQQRLNRAEARLNESQRQLGNFTNTLRSAMMEAGDEGNGLHPFVRVAQRYLGTPYVWGGESARGFDCSGFIMRVMRDLGYRALPHSAAEQFRYGTPIARELLKPGDIVFFANTYKPGVSHVGIYLGRGRFIHAANSKVGTIVSSLHDAKWIAHYAGARRLVRARS